MKNYPIKVVQFGEGNFLRAFIDWMIDILNEKTDFAGNVAVVQPIENGLVDMLNSQNGNYHHVRQGLEGGKTVDEIRKITCIAKGVNPYADPNAYFQLAHEPDLKLVFSNTTEAGIAFDANDNPSNGEVAKTFPGKLTQLLVERFSHFNGDSEKGLSIVPCELIESNGTKLKQCIDDYIQLWGLEASFKNWVDEHCAFANTLVDRIVPGYPKEEIEALTKRIGEEDKLIVKSETFHLFVIQASDRVRKQFPADKIGLNVKYVDDITPFRTQKVRILNGAHTAMVPIGLLNGVETVSEAVDHPKFGKIIREIIFDEIVPTIEIPGEDPAEFAEGVIERFRNPFIRHELISISLNSLSKFKVRILPTYLDYVQIKGKLPEQLTFSFACLLKMYLDQKIALKDEKEFLDFFTSLKGKTNEESANLILGKSEIWGQDLRKIKGLEELVVKHLNDF